MHTTPRIPPTMSVDQAARMLGISRASAYRAVGRGDVPSFRIGRRLRVPTHPVLVLLTRGSNRTETTPAEAAESKPV